MALNDKSNIQSEFDISATAPRSSSKLKEKQVKEIPSLSELERELKREKSRYRGLSILKSVVYSFITLTAVIAIVASLWLPVLEIYGTSMTPYLNDGDVVVSKKVSDFKQGDILAFYYNNQVLIKRVIACSGDWVNITNDGEVYVNNQPLIEPYVKDFSLGDCNIEMPFQVPKGKLFVMGDNREVSLDSRHTAIGCVSQEQIVGKLVFKLWPLSDIEKFD